MLDSENDVKIAKRGQSFAIVGMHFRPPAKALIACLPAGAELVLLPEPGNPYDSHAVKVLVCATAYPKEVRDELALQASGHGFDLEQIDAGEAGANGEAAVFLEDGETGGWWHVGYIPAVKASKDGTFVPEEADFPINWIGEGCKGRHTFDAAGKPMITVAPWPPRAEVSKAEGEAEPCGFASADEVEDED